ncbi:hypothetical protein C8J57DRAFT_1278375, partial [Mycena rebaudengoi]
SQMATQPTASPMRTRRRSLKALLTLPLFPRSSGFPHSLAAPGTPGPLPTDVILEIVAIILPNDILNLSLASSGMRELLLPELYRTVTLSSSRTCMSGLRMLTLRPELCVYIQKLAVRPNYYLAWPRIDDPLNESWVARMIYRLADKLTRLQTFDWDGLEMPMDDLWRSLRINCPELKQLFTNVGYRPLNPDSHLFKFDDLKCFSLSVRHGLEETEIFPTPEELPPKLWDMLIQRCPNLEELTLCSFSASHRLLVLDNITQGLWPSLNSITLGSFGYNANLTLSTPSGLELGSFLSQHPNLSYVRLSWNFKRWMSPDTIPSFFVPTALPSLDSFVGVYQQLAELPAPACASVTSVDLMCEPIYMDRNTALLAALHTLPALTHLDIWLHIPDPKAGHAAFFRALLEACPALEDLHFMCTTRFGKTPLTELTSQLYLLPQLRSFALTKGHRYADEAMLRSALRVYRAPRVPPRLTQVSIRWARAKCRNHLKQEGQYDLVRDSVPGKTDDVRVIEVWERGLRAVGGAFDRRSRYVLGDTD